MLKQIIFLGAAGAVSVTLMGWAKLSSHGATLVQDVREGINLASPDGHEAARIRHLLHDREVELQGQRAKINAIRRKSVAAAEESAALQSAIVKKVAILNRAGEVLEAGAATIEIGGREYTRAQVEQDAREHMRSLKSLRMQHDTKRSIAQELAAAVTRHEADLDVAQQEVRKVEAELDTLDMRLQSAQMRQLAQELSDGLHLETGAGLSELAGSLDSYVARVEEAESRLGVMRHALGEIKVVDWEGATASTNLLDEIRLAVQGKSEADSAPAAAGTRPDVVMARPASTPATKLPAPACPPAKPVVGDVRPTPAASRPVAIPLPAIAPK